MAIASLFLLLCGALLMMFMGLLNLLPPPPEKNADLDEVRRQSARFTDLLNEGRNRAAPIVIKNTTTPLDPADQAGQDPQAGPDLSAPPIGDPTPFGDGMARNDTATGWVGAGEPVEFTDFDAQEEIVSVLLCGDESNPDLTADVDDVTGTVTLFANGQPVALLRDAARDFTMRNVAVLRYAA